MLHSLIQPKRPSGPGWQKVHNPNTAQLDSLGYAHATWIHGQTGTHWRPLPAPPTINASKRD